MPVEDPRAVLHQVHRGGDVGGDAGIGIALHDHLEALAGAVQCPQEAAVATAPGMRREDAGHGGAVVVRAPGVAGVEAGARPFAGAEVVGEVGGVEVHLALDHPDAHRGGRHRGLVCGNAPGVVVHRVHEAVGGPLVRVGRRFAARRPGFGLFALLGGGFLHHHGIDAGLAAQAQHQCIALGQVACRQAQLVDVQRRDRADDLGTVLAGQALGLLGAVAVFFDQQAHQVDVGGQPVHVLRHLIRPGGQHVAAVERQPHRVAAPAIDLEPDRPAAVFAGVHLQAQQALGGLPLHGQGAPTQVQHGVGLAQPAHAEAPGLPGRLQQVPAAGQPLDAQGLRAGLGQAGQGQQHGSEVGGTKGHLRFSWIGPCAVPTARGRLSFR